MENFAKNYSKFKNLIIKYPTLFPNELKFNQEIFKLAKNSHKILTKYFNNYASIEKSNLVKYDNIKKMFEGEHCALLEKIWKNKKKGLSLNSLDLICEKCKINDSKAINSLIIFKECNHKYHFNCLDGKFKCLKCPNY